MIQFKKIPPGKSALLLLLFLTTNISGFLQEYQHEHEISRKTQNSFSMDLQQPATRNMPIRRIGIGRIINEKDGNSERLYDRRSFRTGTIRRSEHINNDRSVEGLQRITADIQDINNNRHRFTVNLQDKFQHTRDNRRSFDSTISRDNRQKLTDNARDANRRYKERSLNERDSNDRIEISSEIRERRNLEIRDKRISDRRTNIESRSIHMQRNVPANERRESRDRQLHKTLVEERLPERRSAKLNENRASPELTRRSVEIRRFVRSADVRDRRVSEENNKFQERSTERERLERIRSRENPLETRTVENRETRISERRVDQRRLSSQVHASNQALSTTERLQKNSRENFLEARNVQDRNKRTSQNRNEDQRRLFFSARLSDPILSSTERSQRNSLSETRTVETRDRRFSENSNTDQRQLSSEARNTGRMITSAQHLQRDHRQNSVQNTFVRQIYGRSSSQQLDSPSAQRSNNVLESRNVGIRARRISDNGHSDQSRSRIVRDRSDRDVRERLSRRSLDKREYNDMRVIREDRERDQTHRETPEVSRRSMVARRFAVQPAERREQKLSDRRERTTDRLQRIDFRDARRVSSQRRDSDTDRVADGRRNNDGRRNSREGRTVNIQEKSRSDSTRYIQDNTYFRALLTDRRDADMISRANPREIKYSVRENGLTNDRYNPLTADSRRYFERVASQRKITRNTEVPALNLENNVYTWTNTLKILLISFLIGQIVVNSSKANKFRFHNIMSMATYAKEKTQ